MADVVYSALLCKQADQGKAGGEVGGVVEKKKTKPNLQINLRCSHIMPMK